MTNTPYYRNTGGAFPVTGRICKPPQGMAGRDDPNQQGRVFAARHDMPPNMGMANPSPGQINQPTPTQMIGKSYHDKWLDEMTCYGVCAPDGSITWQGLHAQWNGPATPVGGTGGAPGTPTYVARGAKR
jgi:hypothetical protein